MIFFVKHITLNITVEFISMPKSLTLHLMKQNIFSQTHESWQQYHAKTHNKQPHICWLSNASFHQLQYLNWIGNWIMKWENENKKEKELGKI